MSIIGAKLGGRGFVDQALSGVRPFWVRLLRLPLPPVSHKLGTALLKDGAAIDY